MNFIRILLLTLFSLLVSACSSAREKIQTLSPESALVAPLIDPAKLATLGERQSNPRIQKVVAILLIAKQAGKDPEKIVSDSIIRIGWDGTEKGTLTAKALIRNLTIVERLGADTLADIESMKRGRSPTVRKGPYDGDIVSVDHIVPRSIVPELDNVIANLELMPLKLNMRKGNKVGSRQMDG